MAEPCAKTTSPRHGIEFREIPTVRGSMYGGSVTLYHPDSYAAILDCVYEMADMVSTSNGVSLERAIEDVCRVENWRLLPKHKEAIVALLTLP